MDRNRITVIINGRQYVVVSDESQEYLKKLAEYVSEKVDYVRQSTKNIMGERPIVLAALNICDEYFKALEGGNAIASQAERNSEKMQKLKEENDRLNEMIEKSDFEIDIKMLQKKLDDAEAEIERLKSLPETKSIEKLEHEHKLEMEALRIEYEAREKEILGIQD